MEKQECIPVGCVPSTTVAVCQWGWGLFAGGCLLGVCLPGVSARHSPVNRMIDRRKNITLPHFVAGGKNQGIRNLLTCTLASRHLTQYVVVMEATVDSRGEKHWGLLDLLNFVKFMSALIDVLIALEWKCSRLLDTKRPKFIEFIEDKGASLAKWPTTTTFYD